MIRWLLLFAACGARGGERAPQSYAGPPPPPPIRVEWKIDGDVERTNITLVVEGKQEAIGTLEGAPNTCALRAANSRRTEILCGDVNAYRADLVAGELVVSLLAGDTKTEVRRLPVYGDALAVKLLVLPN